MKTIIINNAGPRGPVGPQGETGASGSDANVPPLIISSSKQFTDITSPFTGSFTGSFAGDGSNLINVPASGVVGLNLSQISSGTATASISETGGLFVNTHITASGDISASSGTITALTGSFNHIITDDETLEFRSKSAGTKIGQLKFNSVNGLEIQNQLGARAKVRAARGEFLSLEAGPVGMNSLGSITASNDISASGRFIGDGSGLTNVFENTAASSSLSARVTANESAITTLDSSGLLSGSAQIASSISGSFSASSASFSTRISANEIIVAKTLISGSAQIASSISGSFVAPSASFSTRVTANETNISDNRSLITGITSSLSTTGRMVFVGASGILTSEAGFEYNATTNQLSVDNLNVNHLTSSFITASRIFTSGSNIFGDASNDVQTLIGTTKMSGSAQVTGSLNTSGIITGDGSGLTNIPASGIVGLNLSQIASGSATASISPNKGFQINTNTGVTGSLSISGSLIPQIGDNILIGKNVAPSLESGGERNIAIGVNASNGLTTGDDNITIGYYAGRRDTNTESKNIFLGSYTGEYGDQNSSILIGAYNGRYGNGSANVYIGNQTGTGHSGDTGTSNYNVFLGASIASYYGLTSATNNVVIGYQAGRYFTDNDGNTLIGYQAGHDLRYGDYNILIGHENVGVNSTAFNNQLRIGNGTVHVISASLSDGGIKLLGQVSASSYIGDGSSLTGVQAFPFSGSAVITGSLLVSQSIVDFSNASSVVLPAATQPLINPEVRYFTTTVITGSGTTVPIPGGLTFISSSIYEYMEIFINGLRLRYDIDFIPMSTASVQYTFALPVGSEITYKSLKRP